MTQTFTMAFTAKCAECSVCEWSTACNLSGLFFIFFIKSQLLPAFLHLLQSECLRQEVRAGGDQRSGSDLKQPSTAERNTFRQIVYISFVARSCPRVCVCCVCPLFEACQRRVSVDSSNMGHRGVHLISRRQTRRGRMPIADRADRNWWPHPTPGPVYLCRGRACVVAGEHLASLDKLRFARWLMENQGRRLVLPLTDVPLGGQCCVSPGRFAPSTGPLAT